MSLENDFIKRIKELTALAADQENVIFSDQLEAIFPEIVSDESKKTVLIDYLKEKKIGIDEKLDINEFITDDEKKYLEFYYDDLKQIERLSESERLAHTIGAMAGEKSEMDIITNDYLMDVVEIAKLYAGQGVLLEDLIGEGNIALLGAVSMLGSLEEPKEAEGFIGKMVMDAMQDMIAMNMDEMSEEEKLVKKVNKVSKAAKELSTLLGRKVTVEELSEESNISKAAIEKALKLTANKIEGIEV